jgi:hypothetical protein
MAKTDDLVNAWVKKKFLESVHYLSDTLYYGSGKYIEVLSAGVETYCGCYSEYTRDDGFEMNAVLTSPRAGRFTFRIGLWGNLPEFIEELDAFKNAEIDCPYYDEEMGY